MFAGLLKAHVGEHHPETKEIVPSSRKRKVPTYETLKCKVCGQPTGEHKINSHMEKYHKMKFNLKKWGFLKILDLMKAKQISVQFVKPHSNQ